MPKEKSAPNLVDVTEALKKRWIDATASLVEAIEHNGEKGLAAQTQLESFLKEFFPKKYSLGTGFVIASTEDGIRCSSQEDIIVYEEEITPPVFSFDESPYFPIESVYGSIEVKWKLTKKDLIDWKEHVGEIRALAKNKSYLTSVSSKGETGGAVSHVASIKSELPPRGYLVAFDTRLKNFDTFFEWVKTVFGDGTYFHGIYVIEKKWFVGRSAGHKSVHFAWNDEFRLELFIMLMLNQFQSHDVGTYPGDLYRYLPLDMHTEEY